MTFLDRVIEPYRGCHTFIRSIPTIHRINSKAETVVIGNALGDGYGPPPNKGSWKDYFLKEIGGTYDPKRIHFAGEIDYSKHLNILQNSWVHVYLTIPFVLSWSILEAMS